MAMQSILYGSIAGGASIAGVLFVLRWREWTTIHSHFVNSLAAGVILGVAFLGLMPEAIEMNPRALPFVLIGFVIFYVLESVIVVHSGTEIHFEDGGTHALAGRAWTIFAGLFLHSLIDGVIIGIGFQVSHELGLLAATSVILHELPEGVTTFALLINRIKKRTALILSLAVGVATPLGALVGLVALPGVSFEIMGALLAGTAGSFVYVGASDLVPETHTRTGWIKGLFLIAGVLLAYLLSHAVQQH